MSPISDAGMPPCPAPFEGVPPHPDTPPLEIRPLSRAHSGTWFSALTRSRADILQWEGWPESVQSEEEAEVLLQRMESEWSAGQAFHCGIFMEDTLIGCVTACNILWDCRCGDLGYWVDSGFQGRGVAAWAAHAMIGYCFGPLRLQRLEIVIRSDHLASQRVARKLGASFEGIARKRIYHADRAWDAKVYAVVT